MGIMPIKTKIMIAVGIIGLILIVLFQRGLYPKTVDRNLDNNLQTTNDKPTSVKLEQDEQKSSDQSSEPMIISTNPHPLDEVVILPNQVIELRFNTALENAPEFKYSLTPEVKINVELKEENKLIRIIPETNFGLGVSYTLQVKSDTKLAGKKTLNKEYTYHFRTIDYKGV